MNIKEAKEEIKNALEAYHIRDESGAYIYPLVRQRPILLIGPPGVGKTAIMEQIAEECQVGLVSYTLTHHTRQSAIGLPRIVTKSCDGREITLTEYTMSEILASVYECMERTGKHEGILFLDEVNCVSETLAPAMLQLLQNKMFGSHRVPEGWMIVAAGNPPEYNKSVREFDIVTLDRVRKIVVEENLEVWTEYALEHKVHGAILAYLELKKDHFYLLRRDGDEKSFVTARGWEDLSQILYAYEALKIEVGENLVIQYLQETETAEEFTACYRLYRKYGKDYALGQLLEGSLAPEAYQERMEMAERAGFDERLMLIGLLLDGLNLSLADFEKLDGRVKALHGALQGYGTYRKGKGDVPCFSEYIDHRKGQLRTKQRQELIPAPEAEKEHAVIRLLQQYHQIIREEHILDRDQEWERIRELFALQREERSEWKRKMSDRLERAIQFTADCFGAEQEMILLITGLTRSRRAMEFIRAHGCAGYFAYSERLLRRKSERELQEECRKLL